MVILQWWLTVKKILPMIKIMKKIKISPYPAEKDP